MAVTLNMQKNTQLCKMLHNKYFEIMKQFLKGYNKEVYGRNLIGKVKISQKNIALTLNELEKQRIISSKFVGNLKHFSLNKNNPLIKKYLLIAEIENSVKFMEDNPKINQIIEKIDKRGKIVCIFGSYAKGVQRRDSDLDLFIIGEYNEKEIKKIGELFNVEVNIRGGSIEDFLELIQKKNPLVKEIIENHIIASGYEEFVEEVTRQTW